MIFERQQFVNQLIEHIGNNMIKVVICFLNCSIIICSVMGLLKII